MIINDEHLLKTEIYSSEFILERDVEQFLHELLRAADIHDNDEYVLSQIDLFLLKETLRKQLLGKTLILTDENQWNLVYWKNNDTIRPDQLLRLLKKTTNNNTDLENDMDNYVRQTYDKQSFDLYLKYRHLFELHHVNSTDENSTSLKLKPILAYELNKLDRSRFLIQQPIHMTKREDIHSIPIRSILSFDETQQVTDPRVNNSNRLEELQRLVDKLVEELADCKANKHQLPTTGIVYLRMGSKIESKLIRLFFLAAITEITEHTDNISDSAVYESTEVTTVISTTIETTNGKTIAFLECNSYEQLKPTRSQMDVI
jgi:hypothetical protein